MERILHPRDDRTTVDSPTSAIICFRNCNEGQVPQVVECLEVWIGRALISIAGALELMVCGEMSQIDDLSDSQRKPGD